MDIDLSKKTEEIYDTIVHAHEDMVALWLQDVVFTWRWYLGISLVLLPIGLWIFFRNKASTGRLLLAGFFVIIVSMLLDLVGTALGLWRYHYEVVPLIPSHIPWNLVLLPIMTMFFIQIRVGWNPYAKAVLFAVINSLVSEPLAEWVGFYVPVKWNGFYSFPIYIVIYIAAYKLTNKIEFKEI